MCRRPELLLRGVREAAGCGQSVRLGVRKRSQTVRLGSDLGKHNPYDLSRNRCGQKRSFKRSQAFEPKRTLCERLGKAMLHSRGHETQFI